MPWLHHTVLLQEAVNALVDKPDGHYIDATFGRGGHSRAILDKLSPQGRLDAWDRDPQAVQAAQALQTQEARFHIHHRAFADLIQEPPACVDGLLLDLGISSPQIDDPQRGMSFRFDGPLDMRMNPQAGVPVSQWLATAPVNDMARVLRDYGQERFALPIARAIVAHREAHGPLQRTLELARLVAQHVKTREGKQDPATRTFQALRIWINDELGQLQTALEAALRILKPGGRLVVISFHSLEDRLVKQFIVKHSRATAIHPHQPFRSPEDGLSIPLLKGLGRIQPSAQDIRVNPRCRSAILRVAQRTAQALGVSSKGPQP